MEPTSVPRSRSCAMPLNKYKNDSNNNGSFAAEKDTEDKNATKLCEKRAASSTTENMNDNASDDGSSSSSVEPLIKAKLPAYLAEAFGELYGEDGLLVLGRGLGLLSLMAAFVRFYADVNEGHVAVIRDEHDLTSGDDRPVTEQAKPPLVFVIGLREAERNSLISTLETWGTPPELLPTLVTNESGQGKDRAAMYHRGGVFIITSRILIVDLLTNIANPKDVDGILVGHAEKVTEQSTEAFILRIYRTHKRWGQAGHSNSSFGFIKAFTDAADVLMSGFAKVDKILKALHVQRLYLYPRFQVTVADELERSPPYVDELHQELTPLMKDIQGAIAAAVQTCVRELKNSTTLIEWKDSDLKVENCVTTNFDKAISRQLEHDWHRLKPLTKHLVHDLRTLRTLFQYLVQYDCISFWKLINSIKTMSAASRNPSMWLLTPAADLLFRKAKDRVYNIRIPRPTAKVPNPVAQLVPILEENPKWKLLSQVLTEVRNDWKERKKYRRKLPPGHAYWREGGARVLVMMKDEKSLESVRSYLVDGKERTMTLCWLRYLEQMNDRSRSVTKSSGGTGGISEESRLLLEEEGRARNFLFGHGEKAARSTKSMGQVKRKQLKAVPDYLRKKRKVVAERSRGERTMQPDDIRQRAVLDEALEETEQGFRSRTRESYHVSTVDQQNLSDSSEPSDDEDDLAFKVHPLQELRVVLKTYSSVEGEQALLLLSDLNPDYVVLYDADPSFIRNLEVHSNMISTADTSMSESSKHERLRVFFMIFEASSEEKNFLKSLEKEQTAFERLIQHKKTMPLPVNTLGGTTQEMQQAMGGIAGSYAGGALPLSVDTRTGRGKQSTSRERRDIAVDVREFRSALPSILHQGGMRLAPVTLTVGDFVLSNVHCVERKSISDLFGSFASGRLYTQAESMSKHYKCPCLLIEFDPGKTFSLQNSNELGVEIRSDSVCSKMVLLTMHFPKLRILWSRSPHETLKIFKSLKANHEEVDVEKAVEIGSNESVDALLHEEADDEENEINEAARDMLLRLPGVNVHNARKIMKACDSIADLADMAQDELKKLLGPTTGQKLFAFFRQKLAST